MHKFTYSEFYEKAKATLDKAGLPFTAEVMWQGNNGPWLRIVPPSHLSELQLTAVTQLESLIQEDIQRLAEWHKSNP